MLSKLPGYRLLGWSEKFLYDVYGTVEIETGLRRYRDVFISMAKKNGKSTFLGGMPLYYLDQEMEPEASAVGIATNRQQASEVFDSAVALIRANDRLDAAKGGKFEVIKSSKTIIHRETGGRYRVMSSDGRMNDGCKAGLGLVDELHRFKTLADTDNLAAVKRAGRGRTQPLFVKISTAGDPHTSTTWKAEYDYAKQVAAGAVNDPRYYSLIYEAKPDAVVADKNYWTTKQARLDANPSHKEHGGFITDEELVADLERAKQIPMVKQEFLRFTLNLPTDSEAKLFSTEEWAACGTEPHTLIDRECYIGLDLSATSDLTAAVMVFPDGDGAVDVLPFFWCPSEKVHDISHQLGPWGESFRQWVRDGLIETTDGDVVDYSAVRQKLLWARQNFAVREICIDPWNATHLMNELQDDGFMVIKIPQGFAHLSAATKRLQEMIRQRQVRHGGHPVLSWNAASCSGKSDAEGNIKPKKINRSEESVRIDGIAALVNAMCRVQAMTSDPVPVSVSWQA